MYWFFATLDIALRIAAFRRTQHRVFAWYLAFTIPGELICFWLGWIHHDPSSAYYHFWSWYECLALLGLAGSTAEAVGWNLQAGQRRGSRLAIKCRTGRRSGLRSFLVAAPFTASAILILHHSNPWPSFWLSPVMQAIFAANLFLGLLIIAARRWTPHSAILCAWCLFTAALESKNHYHKADNNPGHFSGSGSPADDLLSAASCVRTTSTPRAQDPYIDPLT